MAYDVELADRLREALVGVDGVSEQRMFGGLAFLVHGSLAVSASSRGGLLLRVDPAQAGSLLDPPHVGRFVMRGRELAGWLRVDAEAVATDEELHRWVGLGVAHAGAQGPGGPG
jgi:TfoX/Sxy family transcriptional regulator of competence genes